jgi:hypothetical protein
MYRNLYLKCVPEKIRHRKKRKKENEREEAREYGESTTTIKLSKVGCFEVLDTLIC